MSSARAIVAPANQGMVARITPADVALPQILLVLLAISLVRGVLYAVLSPPFGSPDELDHFQYVAHLATGGASGPRGAEGHQPLPYYLLMVPSYWLTAGEAPAVQDLAIRLASLPFLLGTVLFTWLAARKLAPDRPFVPVVASAFVAFHPQLAYITASANNDSAANFMAAVLTYLMVSMFSKERRWVIPGTIVAIGVALMTKGQILPQLCIAAVALLGLLVRAMVAAPAARWLFYLIPGLLIAGAAIASREGQYLLGRAGISLALLTEGGTVVESARLAGLEPFSYQFISFWAAFLGESTRPPVGWYLIPAAIVLPAATGYVLTIRNRPRTGHWLPPGGVLPRLLLASMIVAHWLILYLHYLRYNDPSYAWRLQVLQGRYLFTLLPALGLLIADGWSTLVGARHRAAAALLVALLIVFDTVSLVSLAGYWVWLPDGR